MNAQEMAKGVMIKPGDHFTVCGCRTGDLSWRGDLFKAAAVEHPYVRARRYQHWSDKLVTIDLGKFEIMPVSNEFVASFETAD